MTLTLLLDLDDTLLKTNVPVFVPAYFQALAQQLAPKVQPEKMLAALRHSTRVMMANDNPARTLQEVFEADFYPRLGVVKEALREDLEYFYDHIFPTLRSITAPVPEAASFIAWASAQGYRIALATDPIMPRKATIHRLCWAGFDSAQFEIVSSFEHFRFSKTHPAYYAELLGRLGWPDGAVLMVGNDIERDILPARTLGLAAYHVDGEAASRSGAEAGAGGTLSDLRSRLEATDLSVLQPSFHTTDSVMGILSASPASLAGLCAELEHSEWVSAPSPHDWALTEIVCHLRDTEREIHQVQIRLFQEQAEPFIPRPDTSVWASQRNYLVEDGINALREFTAARMATVAMLKSTGAEDWSRAARHAIFGPTNFREVVKFMADHDRMHIRQAWKVINDKN